MLALEQFKKALGPITSSLSDAGIERIRNVSSPISVEQLRKIDPELDQLTDSQLISLQDAIYVIVENVVDKYLQDELGSDL